MQIVLAQQVDRDENIVNVAEDQGAFLCITRLLLHKRSRVVPPVAAGVQVVRRVVSIIEGKSVTLSPLSELQFGNLNGRLCSRFYLQGRRPA